MNYRSLHSLFVVVVRNSLSYMRSSSYFPDNTHHCERTPLYAHRQLVAGDIDKRQNSPRHLSHMANSHLLQLLQRCFPRAWIRAQRLATGKAFPTLLVFRTNYNRHICNKTIQCVLETKRRTLTTRRSFNFAKYATRSRHPDRTIVASATGKPHDKQSNQLSILQSLLYAIYALFKQMCSQNGSPLSSKLVNAISQHMLKIDVFSIRLLSHC